MIKLGNNDQVNCPINEYYKFLGYIANHPEEAKIVYEKNKASGAWADEGRIQFYSNKAKINFEKFFKFTKGVGNIQYRLNCNDLIKKMLDMGFSKEGSHNIALIRNNIPSDQVTNFDIGTNL